ncbi:DEAD/DEAH box helicase [Falsiroseomonas sp. E2-1-a20]|uniref:DEAD/DEAH box helicase n=1 Tax=Falsiroseomonas sp. E2-1-a20 TaxID=3239300 RepID=UPI003F408574
MSITLRPYQLTTIERVRKAYRSGARAVLFVMATGGGKTIIFSYIANSAAGLGNRVLILVHRHELIRQASNKLYEAGVEHGIIAPGFTPTRDLVQVASVQTLRRRLGHKHEAPHLIVVDEAHHAVAGQWAAIIKAYPKARLLGVTATPERLDGRGLGVAAGGCFDALVMGPTIAELVAGGFLVPTRIFAPAEAPDLSGVPTKDGDYESSALANAMGAPCLVGDAVAHYRRHAAGMPAILFSPNVAHAEAMAEAFRADGWRSVAVSGQTAQAERDAAIGGLATGAVQVLCSCDLISEGLDVPAVCAVILMRPTQSLGLFLQQVGRGLRPAPGKTHLLVLDHAGNTLRHGPPDAERSWSLEGRPRKTKEETKPPVRQCPECRSVHSPIPACPVCGSVYPVAKRQIEQVAGELSEVTEEMNRQWGKHLPLSQVLSGATDADLPGIARQRGYDAGWVWHQRQRRQRRASA